MKIGGKVLTGNACEQLPGEALYLTAGKGHEAIALQKIEHALPQQVGHYAYVVPEVEAVAEVYAFVPIGFVVHRKCGKHSQLDPRCVTILLHRSYYLDGTSCLFSLVKCFDNFSEGTLAKKLDYVVCRRC